MSLLIGNFLSLLLLAVITKAMVFDVQARRKVYVFLAFVQLLFFHIFIDPDSVKDLQTYYYGYQVFGQASNVFEVVDYELKMEHGWRCLCKFLYYIHTSPRLLLIFVGFIMLYAYSKSIVKYTDCVWIAFVVYFCAFYGQSLFVLRQHLSMAICLLSIPYILQRKLIPFMVLMGISISIHVISIIFVPIYFLYSIRLSNKMWIWLIGIAFFAKIVAVTIFDMLFNISWFSSYRDNLGANYVPFFICFSVFLLWLYVERSKLVQVTGFNKVMLLLLILSLIINFAGVGFAPTNRLVKYYSICLIFIIGNVLPKLPKGIIRNGVCLAIMVMFLLLFLSPSSSSYLLDYELDFNF